MRDDIPTFEHDFQMHGRAIRVRHYQQCGALYGQICSCTTIERDAAKAELEHMRDEVTRDQYAQMLERRKAEK